MAIDVPSDDALVAHAVRCWEAECENATRIANQKQRLASATIALLGLGLYKVELMGSPGQVPTISPCYVSWAVRCLLVLALIMFCVSLRTMYYYSRPVVDTASHLLTIRNDDSHMDGRALALWRTHKAYMELQRRNSKAWEKLHRGQVWFARGGLCVVSAMILVLIFSA